MGDVGSIFGDRGGDGDLSGCAAPAGLKEKTGRALTDFCLWCGIDWRRPAGYDCSDIGRVLVCGSEMDASDGRMGKEKSGFGRSSTGPAVEC